MSPGDLEEGRGGRPTTAQPHQNESPGPTTETTNSSGIKRDETTRNQNDIGKVNEDLSDGNDNGREIKGPRWLNEIIRNEAPKRPGPAYWNAAEKEKEYGKLPARDERSELEVFQSLVGIHFLREGGGVLTKEHRDHIGHLQPVPPLTDIFFPSQAARERFRNRGLYNRVLANDQKNRVMYALSNYVISGLYLLQILIAAAITGLSAYNNSATVTLTVLGAINTVLAGILAWLNGQGMPTRFRRARDQYRECVKAIESSERTFAEINYHNWDGKERPDPFLERDRLEKMYEDARQDQEANYPDTQEGPSKNQMESAKRDLQGRIEEHVKQKGQQKMELDNHKKAIYDLQADKDKLANARLERETLAQAEFERQKKEWQRELDRQRADAGEVERMFQEAQDTMAEQVDDMQADYDMVKELRSKLELSIRDKYRAQRELDGVRTHAEKLERAEDRRRKSDNEERTEDDENGVEKAKESVGDNGKGTDMERINETPSASAPVMISTPKTLNLQERITPSAMQTPERLNISSETKLAPTGTSTEDNDNVNAESGDQNPPRGSIETTRLSEKEEQEKPPFGRRVSSYGSGKGRQDAKHGKRVDMKQMVRNKKAEQAAARQAESSSSTQAQETPLARFDREQREAAEKERQAAAKRWEERMEENRRQEEAEDNNA